MRFIIVILLLSTIHVFSQPYFAPLGYLEIKESPSANSKTIRMGGPSDIYVKDSIGESKLDEIWYLIASADGNRLGWTKKENLKEIDNSVSLNEIGIKRQEQREDRKRRNAILKANKNWPTRIKKNIKKGLICLNMTSEQLVASWNEPISKSSAFILGLGNVQIYNYKGSGASNIVAIIKDDKLIGWTN